MKKYKQIIPGWFIVPILIVSIFLGACQWTTIEPATPAPGNGGDPDNPGDPVSYSSVIQVIFNNKCLACHSTRQPVLTEGNSYNNLISGGYINTTTPASSGLYTKVLSGHPGGSNSTSPSENSSILTWIEEGALDN